MDNCIFDGAGIGHEKGKIRWVDIFEPDCGSFEYYGPSLNFHLSQRSATVTAQERIWGRQQKMDAAPWEPKTKGKK